jgi:hypothetical protein
MRAPWVFRIFTTNSCTVEARSPAKSFHCYRDHHDRVRPCERRPRMRVESVPFSALISKKSATTLWRRPNPSRVMMRQIAGSFAQFEKTKLRGARERIREMRGAQVVCRARPGASPLRPNASIGACLKGIEDHRGRLHRNYTRWATAISRARRTQHLASNRWSKGRRLFN